MAENQNKGTKMHLGRFLVAAAVASALGLEVGGANAQEQDSGVAGLEEITVTARRTEESLQRTPVSVVAIGGDDLAQMGVADLSTLGSFVPNLATGTAMGNSGWAAFAIRGIGGGQGWVYQENGVGLYIDDVYYPRANGALLDLVDVEQIEVLRGPQGTLFGRNSTGGAIRYITKKPQSDFDASLKFAAGNLERRDITGLLNVPVSDNLALRLTAAIKERGGFVKRLNDGVDMGNSDVTALRAQVRWKGDTWDINLAADDTSSENDGVARDIPLISPTDLFPSSLKVPGYSQSLVTPDRFTVRGGSTPDRNTIDSQGVTLTIEGEVFGGAVFKSLTGWRKNETFSNNDWDLTEFDVWATTVLGDLSNWSQEFQLSGELAGGRLNYVGGLYHFVEDIDFVNIRRYARPGVPQTESFQIKTTSQAAYFQGSYAVSDRVGFTAGIRYSKDDKDFFSQFAALTGSNSGSWSSTTGRLGLEFQATEDVMFYASAATGFKAGSFNNRVNAALPNSGILPYDPEKLKTYEIGARSELLENRVRLNATAFYTDYTDIQVSAIFINPTTGAPGQLTQNAAEATMKGVEFELTALLTDNLTINASGAYIDAGYDDVGSPAVGPGGPSLTLNTPFQRTPEYSYTFGASYNSELASGNRLSITADYGWKDKMANNDSATGGFFLPSYGMLNARIGLVVAESGWELALVGTNLLDEEYLTGGFDPSTREKIGGFVQYDLGRPREYGLEVTYKF